MSEVNQTTAIALAEMKACRQAVIDLGAAYGTRSGIYREGTHLMDCIDTLAALLTGDKRFFHFKPHSTPGPALNDGQRWWDHAKEPKG